MKQTTKMGDWKKKIINKKSRGSQTPGNKKGLVPPAWARHCARAGRAYKLDIYSVWNTLANGNKVKWKAA